MESSHAVLFWLLTSLPVAALQAPDAGAVIADSAPEAADEAAAKPAPRRRPSSAPT